MSYLTQSGSLGAVGRIIRILRMKGSMRPKDLLAETMFPRKTFYRALNMLKDVGVVVKEEGEYCWYEHSGARIFESEFEAKLALDHSKKIALGFKQILQRGKYASEGISNVEKYAEYGLNHLETGYVKNYESYEKTNIIVGMLERNEKELKEEIRSRLPSEVFRENTTYFVDFILNDLRRIFEGREPRLLSRIEILGDGFKLDGHIFSKVDYNVVEDFVNSEMMNENNRIRYGAIADLINQYRNTRNSFEEEITELISQVDNGTPLRGRCPLCPKIRISESG